MKRIWIVCIIMLAIIIVSSVSLIHLSSVTEEMELLLLKLEQAIVDQNFYETNQLSLEFSECWEKHEKIIMHYLHHDELDNITGFVFLLPSLAKHEKYAELDAECKRLRHLIVHIRESEFPTIGSIF